MFNKTFKNTQFKNIVKLLLEQQHVYLIMSIGCFIYILNTI